jgi:hypothetical protein
VVIGGWSVVVGGLRLLILMASIREVDAASAQTAGLPAQLLVRSLKR